MKITVNRYLSNDEATLSRVFIDGKFYCFGLEDAYQEKKIAGKTRIPAGRYKVELRKVGGFDSRYKKDRRFADIHEGMLWIRGVPGFEFILIHCGNTHQHTEGCLLLGKGRDEKRMTIWQSGDAYREFYLAVLGAAKAGKLFIEFNDND